MTLSHLDRDGRARMVDVGDKAATARGAVAEGTIRLDAETFTMVSEGRAPKGDVRATAELAGVMAAKRTAELIPLCHPLALDQVTVEVTMAPDLPGVRARATVRCTGRTGVEMEALTAVSVALLTVYDMVKSAGHGPEIGPIRLLEKRGGRSGTWTRQTERQ